METAVSWEAASATPFGLPEPIAKLFRDSGYSDPTLLLGVAEHKVDLIGGNAASQCDVWAIIKTATGMVSLTVEAKAGEAFGKESLEDWFVAGTSARSIQNRQDRWEHIARYLPSPVSPYLPVRYQLLHRCAAAVIEAERFGFQHAAFIVQAFETPETSFQEYEKFCHALGIPAKRGTMERTTVSGITLNIGWADCPQATDAEIATVA